MIIETILTIDPSIVSAGYAISYKGNLIAYNQSSFKDVFSEVEDALIKNKLFIDLIVVESPFIISKGNAWKLAYAAGAFAHGFRSLQNKGCKLWEPKPSQWRKLLGLNSDVDKKRDRDTINRIVFEFCRDQTGLNLRTARGKIQSDVCMAIAMQYAAFKEFSLK
jgi:hypothetical protein